jgi:hypothetical protein
MAADLLALAGALAGIMLGYLAARTIAGLILDYRPSPESLARAPLRSPSPWP